MLTQEEINVICDSGKMIYCFDIDNTICKMESLKRYTPIKPRIEYINKKFNEGNYIYLYTCRAQNGTAKLLKSFGLKYHEIIYGKPKCHIIVDDSVVNSNDYWKNPKAFDLKYKKIGNKINKIVRKK